MLLIPFLWLVMPERDRKTNHIIFVLSSAALLLISSFRSEQMGADYPQYIHYFDAIARFRDAYFERGYVWYNYLLSRISTDYAMLAFGVNMLLFIPLFYHIRNNVENRYWALCVLIFVANPYMYVQTTFNMMRQCCATGFVLIASQFFKKKSLLPSLAGMIFLLIAMQFHRSAILIVPFILPCLFPIKWSGAIWRLIFFVLLGINLTGAVEAICQFFASGLSYGHYATYEASLLNNPPYLVLCLIFIWWMASVYDKLDQATKEDFFVNLFMIGMCLLPVAVKNDAVYRLRIYVQYISLPGMVKIICAYSTKDSARNEIPIKENERVRSGNSSLLELLYVSYFMCFFIGYFTYLYLGDNTAYVPFQFR